MIIARENEIKKLARALASNEAEFIAVYGRRRVGKTFLIREFFQEQDCRLFRATGVNKGELSLQLDKFKQEIEETFYANRKGMQLSRFSNWHNAFEALKDAIDFSPSKKKTVIFLDEVPWMATPRSRFIEALDYYWNRHWSSKPHVKLIICGSAASWIIKNILQDTGGLHNRVTLKLAIRPFTLHEAKLYLHSRGIKYNNQQILTIYMCLGGIPFYLQMLEKGVSAIQNISALCCVKGGGLYGEYKLLFKSLFKHYQSHEKLMGLIAKNRCGISRKELEKLTKQKGGRLTDRLKELEEAGFIMPYYSHSNTRFLHYKVIDEYSLFYLTWIAPKTTHQLTQAIDENYWTALSQQATWKIWSGYSFESICFKHLPALQKALNIPVGTNVYSWQYTPKNNVNDKGAQIDLVFDRPDSVVTLCEIKYRTTEFKITKEYTKNLLQREATYINQTKTKKQIFHAIVTSNGLTKNMYSDDIIDHSATLGDLFVDTPN